MNHSKSTVYSTLYEQKPNMKKLIITSTLSLTLLATGFAQTKKIAHRSHSGTMASLILSTPDNLGEMRMDTWRLAPANPPTPAATVDSTYFEKFACPADSVIIPVDAPTVDPTKTQKREETKDKKQGVPSNKVNKKDTLVANIQIIGDVVEPANFSIAPQTSTDAEPQAAQTKGGSSTWLWVTSFSALSMLLLFWVRFKSRDKATQQ